MKNKKSLSKAGTIAGFMPKSNPYSVQAGEITGEMKTIPSVHEPVSSMTGKEWRGVQAGQIFTLGEVSPLSIRAGEIQGVVETESHLYARGKGGASTFGVQAGQIAPFLNSNNPYHVQAGVVAGVRGTEPEVYEYAKGKEENIEVSNKVGQPLAQNPYALNAGAIMGANNPSNPYYVGAGQIEGSGEPEVHAYSSANGAYYSRYPQLLPYTQASTHKSPSMPEFGNQYPQYTDIWSGACGSCSSFTGQQYNPAEKKVIEEYTNSGSRMSFKEWLNSEKGKNTVNTFGQVASSLYNSLSNKADTVPPNTDDNKGEKKRILGMQPVTFAIVAGLTVIGGFVIIMLFVKAKKG